MLEVERTVSGGDNGQDLTRRREDGTRCAVKLCDLHVGVRHQDGDLSTVDVSCNSTHMLEVMPRIGEAIRKAYFWVPKEQIIYLVLDGAGGHGTDEVVAQCTHDMKELNIILVRQVPNSPDTNVLDLVIWMSLQSAVEKHHRLH